MAGKLRLDGRRRDQLRAVKITPGYVGPADGSCLIEMGDTRVICTASFAAGVPEWLEGKGRGWVTAEYGMLPASTGKRKSRPVLKPDGRATEIGRIIGRVLRGIIDFERLGENTISIDCDVLTADGGTRTAAITGAFVALSLALAGRRAQAAAVAPDVIREPVAAVSVGIVKGVAVLDLDYVEDSSADVDMNVAMTAAGKYVEIQGAAEQAPFDDAQMRAMLDLARKGIRKLIALQRQAIARKPA